MGRGLLAQSLQDRSSDCCCKASPPPRPQILFHFIALKKPLSKHALQKWFFSSLQASNTPHQLILYHERFFRIILLSHSGFFFPFPFLYWEKPEKEQLYLSFPFFSCMMFPYNFSTLPYSWLLKSFTKASNKNLQPFLYDMFFFFSFHFPSCLLFLGSLNQPPLSLSLIIFQLEFGESKF